MPQPLPELDPELRARLMAAMDVGELYPALKEEYKNYSVRDLAVALKMSYGSAHRLLKMAGVQFRSRGGDYR